MIIETHAIALSAGDALEIKGLLSKSPEGVIQSFGVTSDWYNSYPTNRKELCETEENDFLLCLDYEIAETDWGDVVKTLHMVRLADTRRREIYILNKMFKDIPFYPDPDSQATKVLVSVSKTRNTRNGNMFSSETDGEVTIKVSYDCYCGSCKESLYLSTVNLEQKIIVSSK